jgi:hypothetical protein
MKRLVPLIALLAGLIAIQVTAAGARRHPSVTVARVIPVIVQGAGFASAERVKVVVRLPKLYRKTVTATRRGRFTATFRVAAGKCNTIRVSAIGNRGSRASAVSPGSCRI